MQNLAKKSGSGVTPVLDEPEAPLDLTLIESALRPRSRAAREALRLVERNEPKPPSAKGLTSHRKLLEEEAGDSGREVQKQYRNEIIQMKKAMAELRSGEQKGEAEPETASWLERIGEKIGDFLAEPSAGQIMIAVLTILFVFALAFAIVVG